MNFSLLFVLCISLRLGLPLLCYSCQQGYHAENHCSNFLPPDMVELCEGADPECIQIIEWFQNGAIQYVRRQCWTPGNNSVPGGFCSNYDKNPEVAEMKRCKTCKTDRCNGEEIYEPLQFYQCSR